MKNWSPGASMDRELFKVPIWKAEASGEVGWLEYIGELFCFGSSAEGGTCRAAGQGNSRCHNWKCSFGAHVLKSGVISGFDSVGNVACLLTCTREAHKSICSSKAKRRRKVHGPAPLMGHSATLGCHQLMKPRTGNTQFSSLADEELQLSSCFLRTAIRAASFTWSSYIKSIS
nr:uncharacterized protein LOC110362295 isoform X2 [Columba livia]